LRFVACAPPGSAQATYDLIEDGGAMAWGAAPRA